MAVFESIIVYTLCWMVIYLMAKNRYTHLLHLKVRNGNAIVSAAETVRKMPYWLIILSSLIVCYYAYFSMAPEDMMAADRQNYVTNFTGGRESPSLGLTAVMGAVIMAGGDFHMLIYVSVFVSMFVTFCAYRFSKDATPQVLLLLFASQYVLTTLTALKQCYASAFCTLAIVLIIQDIKWKKEIFIWALMLLAMLFHPTGYIIVPTYILIRYYNYKGKDVTKMVLPLFFFSILFVPFLQFLSSVLSGVLPSLVGKIDEYFVEGDTSIEDSKVITIFKGTPFYIISFLSLKYKKRLSDKIPYYNAYMLVTLLCSFLFLMNIYNVWMSRFMYLFQFSVYVFWGMVARCIPKGKYLTNVILIITFLITYRLLYIIGGYF